MLRRIFGSKMDKVKGKWRNQNNKELTDLYSSTNIIRVIKLRRMRRAGHVDRMGERRGAYMVFRGETRWKEATWETQA